jgi:hypothetical protein
MSNLLEPAQAGLLGKLATAVRLVLGVEFLVNGLNWWVKLIDPYPSLSDFAHHTLPVGSDAAHNLVPALIGAGLFHLVKGLELTAGVALLTNLWVPTALVLVAPVTVNVFVVDVFLNNHLRGRLMGSGALLMSVFLMLAYFNTYRPMLVRTARLEGAAEARPFAWFDPLSQPWRTALMIPLGLLSLAVGLIMIGWVFLMVGQHFTRH